MKLAIRSARASDLETFRSLWWGYMEQQEGAGSDVVASAANLASYELVFSRNLDLCLLAFMEELAIGVALGEPAYGLATNRQRTIVLRGVYVLPAWRRLGVSFELFAAGCQTAKDHGFTHVVSHVLLGDERAQLHAAHAGFEPLAQVVVKTL